MAEKIILDIQIDESAITKTLIEIEKELLQLTETKKKLNDSYKNGSVSVEEYAKASVNLQQKTKEVKNAQRDANKELELSQKVTNASENSYESLTAQYIIGQKTLKQLANTLQTNEDGTIELTDEYKKQQGQLETLKSSIIAFDTGIKNGASSVGLYSDAIASATNDLKALIAETKKKT